MSKDIFALLKGSKVAKPIAKSTVAAGTAAKIAPTENPTVQLINTSIAKSTSDTGTTKSTTTTTTTTAILGAALTKKSFADGWKVRGTHLITNLPSKTAFSEAHPPATPLKVAAFDLDGTLVDTESGQKFARSGSDWRWLNSTVLDKLRSLQREEHYVVVIFTNQGGVVASSNTRAIPVSKSYTNFTERVNQIQRKWGSADVLVFASPKRPSSKKTEHLVSSEEAHRATRKPNTGMWAALEKYVAGVDPSYSIDKESSFFVGDAAGRARDFSDSDKKFAEGVGVRFLVPEDVFK